MFKEKKKNARKEVVKTKKKARGEWVRGREGSELLNKLLRERTDVVGVKFV